MFQEILICSLYALWYIFLIKNKQTKKPSNKQKKKIYRILATFSTWDNHNTKAETGTAEQMRLLSSQTLATFHCRSLKKWNELGREMEKEKWWVAFMVLHFLGAQFKKTWGCIWGIAERSQLQLCQCKVSVKIEAIIYIAIYKLLHKVLWKRIRT